MNSRLLFADISLRNITAVSAILRALIRAIHDTLHMSLQRDSKSYQQHGSRGDRRSIHNSLFHEIITLTITFRKPYLTGESFLFVPGSEYCCIKFIKKLPTHAYTHMTKIRTLLTSTCLYYSILFNPK